MVLADCEKPLASMRSNRRIFRIFETKLYSSLEMWETNIEQKRDSCPNYEMRFAPEAGLMRVSWHSLFGNLFRACPSPFGRGWREAPGEGRKCTLIRSFGPPSPRGRRTRASISANLDATGAGGYHAGWRISSCG